MNVKLKKFQQNDLNYLVKRNIVRFRKITLDQIGKKISAGEIQELDIIIKGDVDGSIEACK